MEGAATGFPVHCPHQELTMAIGLGIGLLLIIIGIACEFAVSQYDTPVGSTE